MDTVSPGLIPRELQQKLHRGLTLEYISIAWMSIEGTASVLAGVWAGSLALLAFGGDSYIELLSAYAVANYLRKRQTENTEPKILRKN